MGARRTAPPMKVIARYVYNPEKADRGLKAMADILADAIRRGAKDDSPIGDRSRPGDTL